jgi:hypothetical protein
MPTTIRTIFRTHIEEDPKKQDSVMNYITLGYEKWRLEMILRHSYSQPTEEKCPTQTHTRKYTHIHTYTHTHTGTYTHMYTHTHMHTHTHIYKWLY